MSTQEEGAMYAAECWSKGYNCAESVLRGICHGMHVDLPDRALMMATPFGGGVGRSEDICGALVAGVMAIGAIRGRTNPEQDKFTSYDAAGLLYRDFQGKFGSATCRILNKSDFKSPEHRERCGGIVREATSMTLRILKQ